MSMLGSDGAAKMAQFPTEGLRYRGAKLSVVPELRRIATRLIALPFILGCLCVSGLAESDELSIGCSSARRGSSIIIRNFRGPELHKAASQGDTKRIANLIAGGTNINMGRGTQNGTALGLAVLAGKMDAVKFLLSKGADVNAPDSAGLTPLHSAVAGCRPVIAAVLIRVGADVNARSANGTPLQMAMRLRAVEIISVLRRYGAVPSQRRERRQQLNEEEDRPNRGSAGSGPRQTQPRCRDVGGYEAYMKRTGKVCRID